MHKTQKPVATKENTTPQPEYWVFSRFVPTTRVKKGVLAPRLNPCFQLISALTSVTIPKKKIVLKSRKKSAAKAAAEEKKLSPRTKRNMVLTHRISTSIKTNHRARIKLGFELTRRFFISTTYWRLRFLAFAKYNNKVVLTSRSAAFGQHRNTPYNTLQTPLLRFFVRGSKDVAYITNRKQLWVMFRMRFERFMFKALGCRVYVWFSNLWRTVGSDINGWFAYENYLILRLARKGSRFVIREAKARVLVKSAWLAVTMLGGASVFLQMLGRMLQGFRSHWAVILHTLRTLDACRCYFWYKTIMQYRLTVRGKFGGYLRAGQKTFQYGVVKLNSRTIDLDYCRIQPVTKYGTFSVRFWVQFRDLRNVRIRKVVAEAGGIPGRPDVDI